MPRYKNLSVIESLGTYVPEKKVSSKDISQKLQSFNLPNDIDVQLEAITGIKERRVVANNETSYDLAKKATEICLEQSKYSAKDIDVIISCNISKVDHNNRFQIAPSYSIQLKKDLGFSKAIVFDINNACAGSFTGIHILDSFIKAGTFNNGLIVSGEYISHLSETALKEIVSNKDERMACLTLGDAGVACILNGNFGSDEGMIDENLFTLKGSNYCIGKPTSNLHGGVIMNTDSSGIFATSGKGIAISTKMLFDKNLITFDEDIDHVIMHQVSNPGYQLYLNSINNFVEGEIITEDIMVENVYKFGNTASTSHLLAFDTFIKNGLIKANQTILFSVQASGVTAGSFLYKMKKLPGHSKGSSYKLENNEPSVSDAPKIKFENIEICKGYSDTKQTCIAIEKSLIDFKKSDVNYLIFTGMLKPEYIAEPAYSTILSEATELNNEVNFLAYDITNEGLGWLNSCMILDKETRIGRSNLSLIVTSEINTKLRSNKVENKIVPISTSTLVAPSYNNAGFSHFRFYYYTEFSNDLKFDLSCTGPDLHLSYYESEEFKGNLKVCILSSLNIFMETYEFDLDEFSHILVPQISKKFISTLSESLNSDKVVDLNFEDDLYSASIPCSLHYVAKKCKKNDKVLIVAAGSGIQIGIAIYTF